MDIDELKQHYPFNTIPYIQLREQIQQIYDGDWVQIGDSPEEGCHNPTLEGQERARKMWRNAYDILKPHEIDIYTDNRIIENEDKCYANEIAHSIHAMFLLCEQYHNVVELYDKVDNVAIANNAETKIVSRHEDNYDIKSQNPFTGIDDDKVDVIEEINIPCEEMRKYMFFLDKEIKYLYENAKYFTKYGMGLKKRALFDEIMMLLQAIRYYRKILPENFRDPIFGRRNYTKITNWAYKLYTDFHEFSKKYDNTEYTPFIDLAFRHSSYQDFLSDWVDNEALYSWTRNRLISFKSNKDEEWCDLYHLDGRNYEDLPLIVGRKNTVIKSNVDKSDATNNLTFYKQYYLDTYFVRKQKNELADGEEFLQSEEYNYVYVKKTNTLKAQLSPIVSEIVKDRQQNKDAWNNNRESKGDKLIECGLISIAKEFILLKTETEANYNNSETLRPMFMKFWDFVTNNVDDEKCDNYVAFYYSKYIDFPKMSNEIDGITLTQSHSVAELQKRSATNQEIKEFLLDSLNKQETQLKQELGLDAIEISFFNSGDWDESKYYSFHSLVHKMYLSEDEEYVKKCCEGIYKIQCIQEHKMQVEDEYRDDETNIFDVENKRIRNCFKRYNDKGPILFGIKGKGNETIILFVAMLWLKILKDKRRPTFIKNLQKVIPEIIHTDDDVEKAIKALDAKIKGKKLDTITDSKSVKDFYIAICKQPKQRKSFYERTVEVKNILSPSVC